MRTPLVQDFRFSQRSNIVKDSYVTKQASPQRRQLADRLANRIILSDGGAFLITGYRGVGKTTFVGDVVSKIRRKIEENKNDSHREYLVNTNLNIARPATGMELMHYIVRQLHATLQEMDLLRKLPPKLRKSLDLAKTRTVASLALEASSRVEHTFGVKKILSLSSKMSVSNKQDISYLAYDERSAENDLLELSEQLSEPFYIRTKPIPFWPKQKATLRIMFVFDELDKIEVADDEESPLTNIIQSLKTLFTASGITFIFVAGRSLHDRWIKDVKRGDSIYESVFAEAHYLPALWTDVDAICDPWIDNLQGLNQYQSELYQHFKQYLAYSGRGIPRRIARGFYKNVKWDGVRCNLEISEEERRKIVFFADLHVLLSENEEDFFGDYANERRQDIIDRQRLGLFYLLDWILAYGGKHFTRVDLVKAATEGLDKTIAPKAELLNILINGLIKKLITHQYLKLVTPAKEITFLPGAASASSQITYRVATRRLIEIGYYRDSANDYTTHPQEKEVGKVLDGRFELLKQIGYGASARVYRALDQHTDQTVAIKLFSRAFSSDPAQQSHLLDEINTISKLRHPGIVSLYDCKVDGDHIYIVMEYLAGVSLWETLNADEPVDQYTSIYIVNQILETLQYVHKQNIIWRDVKPSNIMLTEENKVVIVDFGIAQSVHNHAQDATSTTTVFAAGTPAYMSPEHLFMKSVTPASDIYSVGVILYELLIGHRPYAVTQPYELIARWKAVQPAELEGMDTLPAQLQTVIQKAIAYNAEDRYQSAGEMLEALPTIALDDVVHHLTEKTSVPRTITDGIDEDYLTQLTSAFEIPIEAPNEIPAVEPELRSPLSEYDSAVNESKQKPSFFPTFYKRAKSQSAPTPSKVEYTPEEDDQQEDMNATGAWSVLAPGAPPPPTRPLPNSNAIDLESKDVEVMDTDNASATMAGVKSNDALADLQLYYYNDGEEKRYPIGSEPLTIGRYRSCEITISDQQTSRFHAKVFRRNGRYYVEDLNSKNGLYQNEQRVFKQHELRLGDELQIGVTVFKVGQ